jgi:hypothetical protein
MPSQSMRTDAREIVRKRSKPERRAFACLETVVYAEDRRLGECSKRALPRRSTVFPIFCPLRLSNNGRRAAAQNKMACCRICRPSSFSNAQRDDGGPKRYSEDKPCSVPTKYIFRDARLANIFVYNSCRGCCCCLDTCILRTEHYLHCLFRRHVRRPGGRRARDRVVSRAWVLRAPPCQVYGHSRDSPKEGYSSALCIMWRHVFCSVTNRFDWLPSEGSRDRCCD